MTLSILVIGGESNHHPLSFIIDIMRLENSNFIDLSGLHKNNLPIKTYISLSKRPKNLKKHFINNTQKC